MDQGQTDTHDGTKINGEQPASEQPVISNIGDESPAFHQPPSTKQHSRKKTMILLAVVLLAIVITGAICGYYFFSSKNQSEKVSYTASNGYFELPADISKEQALNPTKQQASAIFRQISKSIDVSPEVNKNGIVVNLTKNGEVISNFEKKQTAFGDVAYAEAENKNTYVIADPPDSTFGTWTEAEKASLQATIAKAYALSVEIFGAPANNDTVNIYKQQRRAYYASWGNNGTKTIVLPDDTPDVLAHEIAHSFRSNFVFNNRGWEEGMAMLVNDLFLSRHQNSRKILAQQSYADLNQPIVSTPNFYSDTVLSKEPASELDHYLMAGYAIEKVYLENRDYIKNFNQKYLQAAKTSEYGYVSENDIRNIFTSIASSIEGEDASAWLYSNYILIPSYNESQRVAFINDRVNFLQRDNKNYSTVQYQNAKISQKVLSLDNTQVLDYQLVTDASGKVLSPLFGKVPKAGFYRVVIDAEAKEGAVAHQEYVQYIKNNKLEPSCLVDCIFGATGSSEKVVATDPGGLQLTGKVTNGYFQIDGIKPMTKYVVTQGNKRVNLSVITTPIIILDFSDSQITAKDVSINWESPVDFDPANTDPKLKSALVFKNNTMDYDLPYISICASIDGDYSTESVTINKVKPIMNKGSFCMPFDLQAGSNKFTIQVTPLKGAVVTSTRSINKIGTSTGSYEDLDDITGYTQVSNDTQDSTLAHITISVYLQSKNLEKVLKKVTYGVTVNGGYYKPDRNPYDASVTASMFMIPELKTMSYMADNANIYTKTLDIKIGQYPFESGNRQICLILDVLDSIKESNEDNNMECQTIQVP